MQYKLQKLGSQQYDRHSRSRDQGCKMDRKSNCVMLRLRPTLRKMNCVSCEIAIPLSKSNCYCEKLPNRNCEKL